MISVAPKAAKRKMKVHGNSSSSSSSLQRIVPHVEPIYQTSVWDYPDLASLDEYYGGRLPEGYLYSRNGLPNANHLGRDIALFEKAKWGLVFSSGMAALSVAFLSCLGMGDHILASSELYGGTTVFIRDELSRFGIDSSFVDPSQIDLIEKEIKRNGRKTKLVLVESISNPKMRVADIPKIAELLNSSTASLIVDNTMATPFVLTPHELGAVIVMHSATKFLGGHHDLTMGVLCASDEQLIKQLSQFATRIGAISGPLDCFLASRSLSTWKMRAVKSCENATLLARFLESRSDKVSHVYYPGLNSHPDHELASRIFRDGLYGPMLSFDVRGGYKEAESFVKGLSHTKLTPSLGGVRTTISHPAKTSHRHIVSSKDRKESGITDSMIRVSVGIEDYLDIEKDFELALSKIR